MLVLHTHMAIKQKHTKRYPNIHTRPSFPKTHRDTGIIKRKKLFSLGIF